MIACQQPACKATYSWIGHPTDPALALIAQQAGWRLHEAKGWLCRVHSSRPRGGE